MHASFQWEWTSDATREQLWPLVSDTRRVNRAAGLTPWIFERKSRQTADRTLIGRTRTLGQQITWDELPYEWRAPERMSIERRYHSGPYEAIVSTVTLAAIDGGARLTHRLDVRCRLGILGWLVAQVHLGIATRLGFDRVYRRFFEVAKRPDLEPFPEPVPPMPVAALARMREACELLAKRHDRRLVDRLAALVREGPAPSVHRMRPFALARRWNADRREVLELCLRATRLGLLRMSWRVLCPHCRGSQRTLAMSELTHATSCETCGIDFEADFTRSVELVFAPGDAVRHVEVPEYCIGGPGNTPHVVVQRRVAPGAKESIALALPIGAYAARIQGGRGTVRIALEERGSDATTFRDGDETEATLRPDAELQVVNESAYEQVVVIERREWERDAATADVVTSCQEFRDLFSNEVLARGEEFNVALLAFLFTDLRGSTALYERVGDGPAFSLVREHFALLEAAVRQHEGAVVKTIGDAVMAVFMDPAQALRAAAAMHASLRGAQKAGREELVLRVGVHAGPCLAVNLNDRLDYFGTTVNVAARLQGQSTGGDVVMAESTTKDPGVKSFLDEASPERDPFQAQLKGIRDTATLVRLRFRG